jgi:5-methylcytosine-specific restriction enzyme subunit McrC
VGVLQVLEYEHIRVGERFDPEAKTLTSVQMDRLSLFAERYQALHKVSVFQHGPKGALVAQNMVGLVQLGPDQIEILPKIHGASNVRANLASMIHHAFGLPLQEAGSAAVADNAPHILDVMARLFCRELWRAVHAGLVRRYEANTEQLNVLRGRLNVAKQIALNSGRPDRLHCTHDEFTADHLLNQVLKAALLVLSQAPLSVAASRSVRELLTCFDDVSSVDAKLLLSASAQPTDRLAARYSPLLALARMFLQQSSPDVISGGQQHFALLFDMNELFESYIGQMMRVVASRHGLRVALQGPRNHLLWDERLAPKFELRPDMTLLDGGRICGIVDTKWKRLKEHKSHYGVAQADVYQMAAYGHTYDAPWVTLIYPHHDEIASHAGVKRAYRLKAAPTKEIRIASVDLSDLRTIKDQLFHILDFSAPHTVSRNPF